MRSTVFCLCTGIALTLISQQTNDADDEEWAIVEPPDEPSPPRSPTLEGLDADGVAEQPMRVRSEPKQVRRPRQLVLTVRFDSKTTLLETRRGGKKSAKKTKRGRGHKGKSSAKKKPKLEEPEKDSTETLQPSAKLTNGNAKNSSPKKAKAKRRQSPKAETTAENKCEEATENMPDTATPPQLKAMRKKGCPHIIRIVGDTSSFIADENSLEVVEDVPKSPKRKKKKKKKGGRGSDVRPTSKPTQAPTKRKKKEKKSKITQSSSKENGKRKKGGNVHKRPARRCRR